jgi:nucleoid-associated protein YgaU
MTVLRNSRYNDSYIYYISVVEDGNITSVVTYDFGELGTLNWSDYVWQDGDRLDNIAQSNYRSPYSWWVIAEANPEIEDVLNITPGTVIRVPRRA